MTAERKLKFVGLDSWSRPVYEDKNGRFWKDINLGEGTPSIYKSYPCDEFDGEPDYPIKGEYILINQYRRK